MLAIWGASGDRPSEWSDVMDMGGFLWTVLKFGGPVALLAVIAWATWRNKQSRIPKEVTEAGSRRVYRQEEQARREGRDGDEAA
jgi:hypothetical protein